MYAFSDYEKSFLSLASVLITTTATAATTTKPVNTHIHFAVVATAVATIAVTSVRYANQTETYSATELMYTGYFLVVFVFRLRTRPKTELLCYFTFYGIWVC